VTASQGPKGASPSDRARPTARRTAARRMCGGRGMSERGEAQERSSRPRAIERGRQRATTSVRRPPSERGGRVTTSQGPGTPARAGRSQGAKLASASAGGGRLPDATRSSKERGGRASPSDRARPTVRRTSARRTCGGRGVSENGRVTTSQGPETPARPGQSQGAKLASASDRARPTTRRTAARRTCGGRGVSDVPERAIRPEAAE
jgi:hypothetical protein